MPQFLLLVLQHRQDPVDLDINTADQGQGDQYKNDRENFFQTVTYF
jgi:hypothetical protein